MKTTGSSAAVILLAILGACSGGGGSPGPGQTGVRIALSTPAPTDELVVVVDGGGLGAPVVDHVTGAGMTSASLILGVPAGGPYRVRALAADPASTQGVIIGSASGRATGVTVAAGALTDVDVTLAAPSVEITAPASVEAGNAITISWTYTDPGSALDVPALETSLYYSTSPFLDRAGSASDLPVTGEKLSETSYRWTAHLTAPGTPGTLYYQVTARTMTLALAGQYRSGWYLSPSTARGESLATVTVTPPSEGVRVALSTPAP